MSRVGVIGDLHAPYEKEGYLDFCLDTFKSWKCKTIVMIGDLVDHHAMSFHESEPQLRGAHGELLDARERLKPWFKAFPKVKMVYGNHDIIPARQLKRIGINPDSWLRPLKDVYEMPSGWHLQDEWEIDSFLYHHGYTSVGVNGYRNDAKDRMRNTVSGHIHSNAGVAGYSCGHRLVKGVATGCGIDNSKRAFAYGKHFKYKPIVSCAVVIDDEPFVEYMDLGEN